MFSLKLQVFISTIANIGAFIFGILLGWSAPVASQIINQDDFKFLVTANQFAWVVAMMALGGTLSCVISGIVRSKIGTKLTILAFGFPIIIGFVLITISNSPEMVS
jgi:MFS family permease